MFIRFVSSEVHRNSYVTQGLFGAAHSLRRSIGLPQFEIDVLEELRNWFNDHLESPFEFLPRAMKRPFVGSSQPLASIWHELGN
jgi:hypothetical protein